MYLLLSLSLSLSLYLSLSLSLFFCLSGHVSSSLWCLKGHKSLRVLFGNVFQKCVWGSQSVSESQGNLQSCQVTAKNNVESCKQFNGNTLPDPWNHIRCCIIVVIVICICKNVTPRALKLWHWLNHGCIITVIIITATAMDGKLQSCTHSTAEDAAWFDLFTDGW